MSIHSISEGSLAGQSLTRQPSDFTIFTSIRCDPILSASRDNVEYAHGRGSTLYMPELHRQRMWKAAAVFWPEKRFEILESTEKFEECLGDMLEERERLHETYCCPMKVKFSLAYSGRVTLDLAPVPALPNEALFPTTFRLPSRSSQTTSKSRFAPSTPSSHSPRFVPSPPSPDYFSTHSRASHSSHGSGGTISSASSVSAHSGDSLRSARTELPSTYEIYLDTHPTEQDLHTSFKTSHRPVYNAARDRALPDSTDMTSEVLLFNPEGNITEGSVLTPYFYREGRWITPRVEEAGGQRGTSRRWALERGLCVEGLVERRSVRVGERVWVSNGVRGFGWGKVMAGPGLKARKER